MKRAESKPVLRSIKGKEFPLSGKLLVELLREVLSKGVPFRFRAKGWSMTPFVRDGDVISVAPLRHAPPAVGEVVAFVHQGSEKLLVHRVIARRGDAYVIRGDNVPGQEGGVVPREDILGRVSRVERDGRRVWLGLGWERFFIAFLSRNGLLQPMGRVGSPLRNVLGRLLGVVST